MMKFKINNRKDTLKIDINLFFKITQIIKSSLSFVDALHEL